MKQIITLLAKDLITRCREQLGISLTIDVYKSQAQRASGGHGCD